MDDRGWGESSEECEDKPADKSAADGTEDGQGQQSRTPKTVKLYIFLYISYKHRGQYVWSTYWSGGRL